MAPDQSALLEVLEALKAVEVDDRIRQAAETICQALIEAELASVIGALPHERAGTRTAHRNGHRPRVLASTAGDLELRIPKLRAGPLPEWQQMVELHVLGLLYCAHAALPHLLRTA
jgi:transposase-like protein